MDFFNVSTSAFAPASVEASRKLTPPRPKTVPTKSRTRTKFHTLFRPRGRFQKRSLKNALRQALRDAPGRSSRLLEAEIDQLFGPRGPQEAPHEFFGPPGRPRAAAKSDLRRSRRPPWAHMAPRSSQDPSGPSFWTLRPLPWSMFHPFSEIAGHLF